MTAQSLVRFQSSLSELQKPQGIQSPPSTGITRRSQHVARDALRCVLHSAQLRRPQQDDQRFIQLQLHQGRSTCGQLGTGG